MQNNIIPKELNTISKVADNIYLSGIYPMYDPDLIKRLNIKFILSCVDRKYVSQIHDGLFSQNPNLVILYLPYNDDIHQNLWTINKNKIEVVKLVKTPKCAQLIETMNIFYNNKPLIEIGYHFINQALNTNSNILIHCMAGVSRSVSLTSYFLMKKCSLDFESALQYIKSKRRIVNPNPSFRSQLIASTNNSLFNENCASNIINSIIEKISGI